jgi:hypothetical protein
MDRGYWIIVVTCMWRLLRSFHDLALDLWCLFITSQPPTLRSISSTLIYGWLEPHMPLGGFYCTSIEVGMSIYGPLHLSDLVFQPSISMIMMRTST